MTYGSQVIAIYFKVTLCAYNTYPHIPLLENWIQMVGVGICVVLSFYSFPLFEYNLGQHWFLFSPSIITERSGTLWHLDTNDL